MRYARTKKPQHKLRFFKRCVLKSLGFFYQAGFKSLCAYPNALDGAAFGAYANTLNIGLKSAVNLFYKLQTDTAALFALTFVYDFAAGYGTLTCY